MSLNKSKGNMYPWVTHTHSHLGGECSHRCVYCYVDNPRFGRPERFRGALRLIEDEFGVNYGRWKDQTIFVEHCNDLFAKDVPERWIQNILEHCWSGKENTFVFQTKNPIRYHTDELQRFFPPNRILGTTIETNRMIPGISSAPAPVYRYLAMRSLEGRKFITIEPVLDFDVEEMAGWIADIKPEFLNLGADSKNHGLPEPTIEKIMELTFRLADMGIELREKRNLQRLKSS